MSLLKRVHTKLVRQPASKNPIQLRGERSKDLYPDRCDKRGTPKIQWSYKRLSLQEKIKLGMHIHMQLHWPVSITSYVFIYI